MVGCAGPVPSSWVSFCCRSFPFLLRIQHGGRRTSLWLNAAFGIGLSHTCILIFITFIQCACMCMCVGMCARVHAGKRFEKCCWCFQARLGIRSVITAAKKMSVNFTRSCWLFQRTQFWVKIHSMGCFSKLGSHVILASQGLLGAAGAYWLGAQAQQEQGQAGWSRAHADGSPSSTTVIKKCHLLKGFRMTQEILMVYLENIAISINRKTSPYHLTLLASDIMSSRTFCKRKNKNYFIIRWLLSLFPKEQTRVFLPLSYFLFNLLKN